MNIRTIAFAVISLDFAALTAWAIAHHGATGWATDLLAAGPVGILAGVDLIIALAFAMAWMIRDAKQQQLVVWPYVVVTCLTGSLGLLLYATRRNMNPGLAQKTV